MGGASARLVAIVTMADAEQATALLPAPRIDVDALPYIDSQYNNPRMKAHVDALIEAELKTFRPSGDHLERWPMYEPNFEVRQGPGNPRVAPRTSRGTRSPLNPCVCLLAGSPSSRG